MEYFITLVKRQKIKSKSCATFDINIICRTKKAMHVIWDLIIILLFANYFCYGDEIQSGRTLMQSRSHQLKRFATTSRKGDKLPPPNCESKKYVQITGHPYGQTNNNVITFKNGLIHSSLVSRTLLIPEWLSSSIYPYFSVSVLGDLFCFAEERSIDLTGADIVQFSAYELYFSDATIPPDSWDDKLVYSRISQTLRFTAALWSSPTRLLQDKFLRLVENNLRKNVQSGTSYFDFSVVQKKLLDGFCDENMEREFKTSDFQADDIAMDRGEWSDGAREAAHPLCHMPRDFVTRTCKLHSRACERMYILWDGVGNDIDEYRNAGALISVDARNEILQYLLLNAQEYPSICEHVDDRGKATFSACAPAPYMLVEGPKPPGDGILVQVPGQDSVYLILDGMTHKIPNMDTFLAFRFHGPSIVKITAADFEKIPQGDTLADLSDLTIKKRTWQYQHISFQRLLLTYVDVLAAIHCDFFVMNPLSSMGWSVYAIRAMLSLPSVPLTKQPGTIGNLYFLANGINPTAEEPAPGHEVLAAKGWRYLHKALNLTQVHLESLSVTSSSAASSNPSASGDGGPVALRPKQAASVTETATQASSATESANESIRGVDEQRAPRPPVEAAAVVTATAMTVSAVTNAATEVGTNSGSSSSSPRIASGSDDPDCSHGPFIFDATCQAVNTAAASIGEKDKTEVGAMMDSLKVQLVLATVYGLAVIPNPSCFESHKHRVNLQSFFGWGDSNLVCAASVLSKLGSSDRSGLGDASSSSNEMNLISIALPTSSISDSAGTSTTSTSSASGIYKNSFNSELLDICEAITRREGFKAKVEEYSQPSKTGVFRRFHDAMDVPENKSPKSVFVLSGSRSTYWIEDYGCTRKYISDHYAMSVSIAQTSQQKDVYTGTGMSSSPRSAYKFDRSAINVALHFTETENDRATIKFLTTVIHHLLGVNSVLGEEIVLVHVFSEVWNPHFDHLSSRLPLTIFHTGNYSELKSDIDHMAAADVFIASSTPYSALLAALNVNGVIISPKVHNFAHLPNVIEMEPIARSSLEDFNRIFCSMSLYVQTKPVGCVRNISPELRAASLPRGGRKHALRKSEPKAVLTS